MRKLPQQFALEVINHKGATYPEVRIGDHVLVELTPLGLGISVQNARLSEYRYLSAASADKLSATLAEAAEYLREVTRLIKESK